MAFNNLAENAERLSKRIQETLQERTRELTKASSISYLDAPDLDKPGNIQRLLDSSSEREKLEGLKRLIALISKGRNVSQHFAQVVKNVASHNLEIRKLVYIYLLRYAESEPDLALLSINTFQKDLKDSNPLIRAMALRVLSGIPVPMIGSIVALGIKQCAADMNPYVKKAAALAIPKLYNLDTTHLPALMQILQKLLHDRSPLSIGCIAVAFLAVCPHRLELLHPHYRRLCRILVDADEWGQVHLLDLLGRYARTMLSKPTRTPSRPRPSSHHDDEDEDEQKGYPQEESFGDDAGEEVELDSDLDLLLKSAAPLFHSRNPSVVLAACRTFYYLGPPSQHHKIVVPLLRSLHSSKEIERVVLEDIFIIARKSPELFVSHTSRFYIRASDLHQTKLVKLRILVCLINFENVQTLLREFKDYVLDTDDDLVSEAIWAIGKCAHVAPDATDGSLSALTMLIRSQHEVAVSSAVLALKSLHEVQQQRQQSQPSSSKKSINVVARLARSFENIKNPKARACILWMVGQYSEDPSTASAADVISGEGGIIPGITPWAPDTLRKAVKSFSDDAPIVKLQALTLAAKLFVLSPAHPALGLLARYIFSLARYDPDYDVRDRGRLLSSLLSGVGDGLQAVAEGDDEEEIEERKLEGVILRREQVRLVLFDGKQLPDDSEHLGGNIPSDAVMGSMAIIIHKDLPGKNLRSFPDWPDEGTDSSFRDTEEDHPPAPFYSQSGGAGQHTSSRIVGIGSHNVNIPSPVVLTPGNPSPVGSAPSGKGGVTKGPWMDLDKFYDTSSGDDDDDDDDDEDDEEEEEEEENASPPASNPASFVPPSSLASRRHNPPADPAISAFYQEEEEEEEGEGEDDEESEEGDDENEDNPFLR